VRSTAKQAMKDSKKLAASGLKPKAQDLLAVLAIDPFQNPRLSRGWSVILPAHILAASIFRSGSFTKSLPRRERFVFCVCGLTTSEQPLHSRVSPRSGRDPLTQS
jgi:hypothetical protein